MLRRSVRFSVKLDAECCLLSERKCSMRQKQKEEIKRKIDISCFK